MKNHWNRFVWVALIVVVGCAKEPAPAPQASSAAPVGASEDGHNHGEAPRGGTLVDWGGGVYHVEFTVDHDAKSSTAYILGDDAQTASPVNAEKLLLTIKEPAFQVELIAQPQPGESPGTASKFTGTHEHLGIVREFAGTISGEVNGTPYAGDFAEVAGDHGHTHATPHDGAVASRESDSG